MTLDDGRGGGERNIGDQTRYRRTTVRHRPSRAAWLLLGTGIGLVLLSLALEQWSGADFFGVRSLEPLSSGFGTAPAPGLQPMASRYQPLTLSINANPHAICVDDSTLCAARGGESEVTMTAVAPTAGFQTWPAVQVAFVIETTLYDGVYDPEETSDPCSVAFGSKPACEESNGVPFFISHAQQIADAIQQANPHTNVSFAMVDYFATLTDHDDGDGALYHVDIPQFISSQSFGAQVVSNFQATVLGGGWVYIDVDFADNILHTSSITALYGTIIGSGLDWSPATHHVIVWMGSSAPRDPNYLQNYAVSAHNYEASGWSGSCEPAYSFGALTSPNCEGWVRSQDGNRTHSIAQLAKTSPTCTNSIGGVCTIDTIDLYATPTDPYSKGWPCNTNLQKIGGCPGGSQVLANTAKVLLAGCDLAAATGGTWNGPNYFSCPNGDVGHLQPVFIGSDIYHPNLQNPSLFQAFRGIGFGPVISSQVANGTHQPIFQFVPFGNIRLVPHQPIVASCLLPNGEPFRYCDHDATIINRSGVISLGWNWSSVPKYNQMYLGDVWTVSFLVYAAGPPTTTVPVDACITAACRAGLSGAVGGLYTWATYIPVTNNTVVTQSFPLATVSVQALPGVAPPPTPPPPPPPVPPPFAIPVAPPVPILTAVGITAQVGVASVSLQAISAGFLGAGFIRVQIRNKPIANPVLLAQYKHRKGSMFDRQSSARSFVGRME